MNKDVLMFVHHYIGRGGGRGSFGGPGTPSNRLFVGNLCYDTEQSSLQALFPEATDVFIPMNRDTGKGKGWVCSCSMHVPRRIRINFLMCVVSGAFFAHMFVKLKVDIDCTLHNFVYVSPMDVGIIALNFLYVMRCSTCFPVLFKVWLCHV